MSDRTALQVWARAHCRCLFARRKDALEEVKAECEKLGAGEVIIVAGDITSPKDLLAVRQAAVDGEWSVVLMYMSRS